MSGQYRPCQVPNMQVVWVQNHLHFKLLRELDYSGVFGTVMKRALLKKGPLVAILTTLQTEMTQYRNPRSSVLVFRALP